MGTNEHLRPLAVRAGRECDFGAGVQSWGVEGGRPSGHLGVSVPAAFSPALPRSAQGLGGLTPLLYLCLHSHGEWFRNAHGLACQASGLAFYQNDQERGRFPPGGLLRE